MNDFARRGADPSGLARVASIALGIGLAASIAAYVLHIVVPLLQTSALADDYRQAAIWMVQVHAGKLFAEDPITRYSQEFQPPVLSVLYGWLARAWHPYAFTKVASLALLGAFFATCAAIGHRIAGRVGALLLATLAIADREWTTVVMGGVARSYAAPLLAALVWALLARRPRVVVALLAVAGALHPQTMLIGVALVLVNAALEAWRARRLPSLDGERRKLVFVGACVVALCLLVNAVHLQAIEKRFGPMLSRSELLALPEMKDAGRWSNERPDAMPIEAARAIGKHMGWIGASLDADRYDPAAQRWALSAALLVLLGLALEGLRRAGGSSWRELPSIVPALALVGCAGDVAANVLLPRLYFPRRFLEISLPLAVQIALAALLAAWIGRALAKGGRARLVALPLLVLALFVGSYAARAARMRFPGYWVGIQQLEGVARFLSATPVDTVYAARPEGDADTLAALVPRRVYVAREIGHPLFEDYLMEVIRPRTTKVWRAIFSDDPVADMLALRADGVDLLVLREADVVLRSLDERIVDQPYLSRLMRAGIADPARRIAFWTRMAAAIVHEDDGYAIVDLARLEKLARS